MFISFVDFFELRLWMLQMIYFCPATLFGNNQRNLQFFLSGSNSFELSKLVDVLYLCYSRYYVKSRWNLSYMKQMFLYNPLEMLFRRGTARTLPHSFFSLILLFYVFLFVLFNVLLCVIVYCQRMITQLHSINIMIMNDTFPTHFEKDNSLFLWNGGKFFRY
jgi:hypothetical protein